MVPFGYKEKEKREESESILIFFLPKGFKKSADFSFIISHLTPRFQSPSLLISLSRISSSRSPTSSSYFTQVYFTRTSLSISIFLPLPHIQFSHYFAFRFYPSLLSSFFFIFASVSFSLPCNRVSPSHTMLLSSYRRFIPPSFLHVPFPANFSSFFLHVAFSLPPTL